MSPVSPLRCGRTNWYRGRVVEPGRARKVVDAFDIAEQYGRHRARKVVRDFVATLNCPEGCRPKRFSSADIQYEYTRLWGRPSRDLPGFYEVRLQIDYRFPVSCPPEPVEEPPIIELPPEDAGGGSVGGGSGSDPDPDPDPEDEGQEADPPPRCDVGIAVDAGPLDGGPSMGRNYERTFELYGTSSLGHELGVVRVTAVESEGTLGNSALPPSRFDVDGGDADDETPVTTVTTDIPYTSTREVVGVISATYKCPECGAHGERRFTKPLNTNR